MTPKQAQILSALSELGDKHPTVRSLSYQGEKNEVRYKATSEETDA